MLSVLSLGVSAYIPLYALEEPIVGRLKSSIGPVSWLFCHSQQAALLPVEAVVGGSGWARQSSGAGRSLTEFDGGELGIGSDAEQIGRASCRERV